MILRAILGRCHSGILFENITEIVRVVVSRFSRYLRTFDIGGAKHFLGFVESEENKILREGLTVLLRKDGGESAVTHTDCLGNILKHKIGVGEMLGHVKLGFTDNSGRIGIIGNLSHLSCSENHGLFRFSLYKDMSDVTCGLKAA